MYRQKQDDSVLNYLTTNNQPATGVPKFDKDKHVKKLIDILEEQLSIFKDNNIITSYRDAEGWEASGVPQGVENVPQLKNFGVVFEDLITQVKLYPQQKFDLDCSVPLDKIYEITDHNRLPKHEKCVKHMKDANGFNYQKAGRITVYLVEFDGEICCIVEMGNHRVLMSLFQFGKLGSIRANVVYLGTLELEKVLKMGIYEVHHADMNKRLPQTVENRIISGVKADDKDMIKVYNWLCECNLTVLDSNKEYFNDTITCLISSWPNFEKNVQKFGLDNVEYATSKIQKYAEDGQEKVLSQTQETIAGVKFLYTKEVDAWSEDLGKDFLEASLKDYFVTKGNTQSDMKESGDFAMNVMDFLKHMNRFGKKHVSYRAHKFATPTSFLKYFPDFKGSLSL